MEKHNDIFVMDAYDERLSIAAQSSAHIFSRPVERELLPAYDPSGKPAGILVPNGAAHRLGIIHQTADVLLLTPDGVPILKQRAHDDSMFAGMFSFPAGGHSVDGESAVDTAVRELSEETGLQISDCDRLLPLHGNTGLPLFYREWRAVSNGCSSATFSRQFSKAGYISTRVVPSHGQNLEWPQCFERWKWPLGGNGDLALLNQEITFYFLLVLSSCEYRFLLDHSDKRGAYGTLGFDELLTLSRNESKATDGLKCLFSDSHRAALIAELVTLHTHSPMAQHGGT